MLEISLNVYYTIALAIVVLMTGDPRGGMQCFLVPS